MPLFTHRSACASAKGATTALCVLVVAACSSGRERADTTASPGSGAAVTSGTASAGAATTPPDTMAGMQSSRGTQGTSAMGNMTGDPDHDFLRMMSDHHKGLILLAHMTNDRKDNGPAGQDAKTLDAEQDAELDKMMSMLERDFKDPYAPKVIPEHRQMADDLKARSGKEYDRTFLHDVIRHHEEAIKMIDHFVPRAKRPMVKQMAEKMKADQTKEIERMKGQLSALGG